MRAILIALLAPAAWVVAAGAQEWPQFRGPTGQGHATGRSLPADWSESKHIAWKTPVPGLGWSSPVVAGGRVWLSTATGDRDISLRALAYDAASGREVVNVELFRLRNAREWHLHHAAVQSL